MMLTLTLGFAGAISYELYLDPCYGALSLRNKVRKEEEVAMVRVN